jgi:hypothetical protein
VGFKFTLAVGLFLLFSSLSAQALEWPSQSLLWDDAQVLTAGAGAWTFSHQSKNVDGRYGESGQPELVGRSTKQYRRDDGVTTIREFQMRLHYQRWTPMWAFGISPRWTIMARLPVTRIQADSSEHVYLENGARAGLSVRPASAEAARDFHAQDISTPSGLQSPPQGDYQTTRLGQFEIRSKYQAYREGKTRLVATQILKFPTAENTKVDFIAFPNPLPAGFAAGLGMAASWNVRGSFNVVYSGEYLYRFQDEVHGRTRDGFPTESLVKRQPGAEMQTQSGLRYGFSDTYFVQTGARMQMKEKDRYDEAAAQDLQTFGEEERSSFYVSLAYRPLSRLQQISLNGLSLAGQLGWETAFAGRNVEDGDILNLEVQVQF